jgi:CrcB protein
VLRYWLSGVVQGFVPRSSFPYGTLAVNLTGCLVIGLLAELAEARGFLGPETRALLFVGLLGGYTTFSAFANETVSALRDGATTAAVINILMTVGGCLAAVWAGRAFAALVWR